MQLNTAPVETAEDIDLIIQNDDRWDEEDDMDEIDWQLMGLRRQIETQGSLKVMH